MQSTRTWPERAAFMLREVTLDVARLKEEAAYGLVSGRAAFRRSCHALEKKLEAARKRVAEIDDREAWDRLIADLGRMWSDLSRRVRGRTGS